MSCWRDIRSQSRRDDVVQGYHFFYQPLEQNIDGDPRHGCVILPGVCEQERKQRMMRVIKTGDATRSPHH